MVPFIRKPLKRICVSYSGRGMEATTGKINIETFEDNLFQLPW